MSERKRPDENVPDSVNERTTARGADSLLLEPDGRGWAERLGALVLLLAFAVGGGLPGTLAAVVTLGVWTVLGTPYAVAAGVVSLLAVFPDGIAPLSVGLVGAGLLALVVAPAPRAPYPVAFGAATLASALGLGGLTLMVARSAPLWLAGAVLLGAIGVSAYGLHRYELVRLGLVSDATTTDDNA